MGLPASAFLDDDEQPDNAMAIEHMTKAIRMMRNEFLVFIWQNYEHKFINLPVR